ncbi:HesA/MoeB/ThiF family protein [Thalassovita sp.]|uniref:HesA/MoeB/ThiF family protein n=1 Tax=Thalassovita sp. TaxID=1979401 RepID=UPI0029DE7AFC|nr:HesA/MoeB/ThiF family protein [Thalassovita sp.]
MAGCYTGTRVVTRYDRQICLPEVGAKGQSLLSQAAILVIGAGGLGSAVLPMLAGAGCGQIMIVDPDRVEVGNLHRQTLYRMADIGQAKAECAARTLMDLNPDCRVQAHEARMDPVLARQLVPQASVVVDAADSFAVTYALSDICLAAGVPLISASVLGRTGYVGGFCGGAPGYRAVFPDLPPHVLTCATAGVMGPVVAMLGTMQAQMVLSVLLGHDPGPLGQIMSVDMAGWRVSSFRFDGAPDPLASPLVVGAAELTPDDLVIELRDARETPFLMVPGMRRLAPDKVDHLDAGGAARVVFTCASGLRAWRAAVRFSARSPMPVAILAGGA